MNEQTTIVRLTEVGPGLTNWKRLKSMTDEDIDAAIASDPDWLAFERGDFFSRRGRISHDPVETLMSGMSRKWGRRLRNSEIRALRAALGS